jgi:hypothetical protein
MSPSMGVRSLQMGPRKNDTSLSFAKTPSSRQVGDLSEKSRRDRGGLLWIHCQTCPRLPGPGRLGRSLGRQRPTDVPVIKNSVCWLRLNLPGCPSPYVKALRCQA